MSQSVLLDKGLRLVELGYRIIPIPAGRKGPTLDGWQKTEATEADVRGWAKNGYAHGNVGILTRYNPAIDLDIYDQDVAEAMEAWCLENLGAAPVRIGMAPKRLLVFAALRPFKKMRLDAFDAFGDKHGIEILGDGQQFVAYGIHPDTKRPYTWVRNGEVADIAADFLPELTPEGAQAALDAFSRIAQEHGWEVGGKKASRALTVSDDSGLEGFKPVLDLDPDELKEALQHVDGAEDYDRWLQVGMALHHQFQGDEEGLALWDEWSQQASNYDGDALERKWKSFSALPSGHSAITAATILKIANDNKAREAQDNFNAALGLIRTCKNESELFGKVAKAVSKALVYDFQFDIAAKAMQERAAEITGTPIRIETIRKALTPIKAVADKKKRPAWCEGWVYVESLDRFFNADTKVELTEKSFNARYDREVLSKEDRMTGKGVPDTRAATLALNIYEVPTVSRKVYLPGFSKLVSMNGESCVNIYDDSALPPSETAKTPEEKAALQIVKDHFRVLFPNDRERHLVIDFLAYNVQFPNERINWALVVQGVDGAGKSWMQSLMAAVLGEKNVAPLSAKALHSEFTGWAEGRKMVFVEEIRLHGQNRFEAIDNIKPYITNDWVSIRRMRMDEYKIPNVTNYAMYTNHWDALPINESDRRFFIVSTSFQVASDIEEFNERNPDHFTKLFEATNNFPHIMRGWLMSWKLSDEFDPKRHAPKTAAKAKMREIARGDEIEAINDIVEGGHAPDLSEFMLNTGKLVEQAPLLAQVSMPGTRALSNLLAQAGFVYVDRVRLPGDPKKVRIYTKHPRLYEGKNVLEVCKAILSGEPPELML